VAQMDANAVAQRWASRLGASTQRITDGINAVTVAPGQAAAQQAAAYAQNVAAAVPKWRARVGAVTLADWQHATITKGVQRIGAGATAAEPKMANFFGRLLPYINSGKAGLPARGNYDQNKARMNAWVDYMHKFTNAGR